MFTRLDWENFKMLVANYQPTDPWSVRGVRRCEEQNGKKPGDVGRERALSSLHPPRLGVRFVSLSLISMR